ncbi:hypothetical protein [Streptomyces sp. NK15101]|uniref:hypothetical protein n=1 Tax=Streptomyces sp. NK15101 TaxID=2873261 RepID=UPI001CEDF17E|nr:hypothetical protein [Streptomyces sp. NK15101]
MTVLIWLLLAIGVLAVAICAVHVHRHHGPTREVSVVLPLAGLSALPALLVEDASAAAWGLWGVTGIAAALTWAVADTLRDIPATPPARSRRAR